jgi:hypothetical protein
MATTTTTTQQQQPTAAPVKIKQSPLSSPLAALDFASSQVTAAYLPVLNAMIAEDTRGLFQVAPFDIEIFGARFVNEHGQFLVGLKTIQSRLKDYYYRRGQDIIRDIEYLFNSVLDNQPFTLNGDQHKYTLGVHDVFRTLTKDFDHSLMNLSPTMSQYWYTSNTSKRNYIHTKMRKVSEDLEVKRMKQEMVELQKQVDALKDMLAATKKKTTRKPRSAPAPVVAPPPTKPKPTPPPVPVTKEKKKRAFSLSQKEKMSAQIGELAYCHINGVLEIIRKDNTCSRSANGDVEVDLCSLSTETLTEIQAYLKQHLPKKPKTTKKAAAAKPVVNSLPSPQ